MDMRIKSTFVFLLSLLLALSLITCVDSRYDLSDIDSTSAIKVKDLVFPISIDAITLESIVDIDDHNQIKVINGEYAFMDEGSVERGNIEVPSLTISAPEAKSVERVMSLTSFGIDPSTTTPGDIIFINSIRDDFRLYSAEIDNESSFSIDSENVNPAVVKIDTIATSNFLIKIYIGISELNRIFNSIEVHDLTVQLPKGLTATSSDGGVYDTRTGILTFADYIRFNENLEKEITIDISKIDAKQAGIELTDGNLLFEIESSISGVFALHGRNLKKPVTLEEFKKLKDPTLEVEISFPNGDIDIAEFSGDVRFEYDDINFASFTIEELPKLINQEGTDIRIANPQIYLTINNPLYDSYQLEATAGVDLFPTDIVFEDKLIFNKTINRYCLSPIKPDSMLVAGSVFTEFPDLGDILSGDDRPDEIDINVVDIEVPQQTVKNFVFGKDYGKVVGEYLIYAPATFTHKAEIHYADTLDGWSDDGLDKMTIDNLRVTAKVNSNIPLSFRAVAYPIDKDGNYLTVDGQPIKTIVQYVDSEGESFDILPPFVKSSVLIEFKNRLKNVDGIIFKAILNGTKEIHPLKPKQSIMFTDIKLNVSGEYIDEF
mgnify:FL=1